MRQLARKKIKLETSSSIDTSSSLASSSSSASGGGGRSSLTSSPAATKKSPARKDVGGGGGGGPVLTHTPVSSALRLAKGMEEWLCSLHSHTMGDCTYMCMYLSF